VDARHLTARVARLLGRPESAFELRPGKHGGNNQVLFVSGDELSVVVKRYFRGASDTRDRLEAEWSFLGYAECIGIGCVPRRIAVDRRAGLAVYEHVQGERLSSADVGAEAVRSAAEFFLALNDGEHTGYAGALADASEACFSIRDHLRLVDHRVERLSTMRKESGIDAAALAFVADLRRSWQRLKDRVAADAGRLDMALGARLPMADRCISPSDFGFHNALRRPDGQICFLDFEYAGWDDPAKMASDFFCQPAVPVDWRHFEAFADQTLAYSHDGKRLKARTRLLQPVFRTKWCCIMLNEFLPESAGRRRFADPAFDEQERKRVQLEKASTAFHSIEQE